MRKLISIVQEAGNFISFKVLKMIRILIISSMGYVVVSCSEDSSILPVLNTLEAADSDIASTTATLKGVVVSAGNMNIVEYGIELSANQLFSPSQTSSIQGIPPTGEFQVQFTNLQPNTLYYFKAYALVNTANVYSQNREQFTTKP